LVFGEFSKGNKGREPVSKDVPAFPEKHYFELSLALAFKWLRAAAHQASAPGPAVFILYIVCDSAIVMAS
jgi:hypothetical protein